MGGREEEEGGGDAGACIMANYRHDRKPTSSIYSASTSMTNISTINALVPPRIRVCKHLMEKNFQDGYCARKIWVTTSFKT